MQATGTVEIVTPHREKLRGQLNVWQTIWIIKYPPG